MSSLPILIALATIAIAVVITVGVALYVSSQSSSGAKPVSRSSLTHATDRRLGRIGLGKAIANALKRGSLDSEAIKDIETTLITADVGVATTELIVNALQRNADGDSITDALHSIVLDIIDPTVDRSLKTKAGDKPAVVMVVGVNGTGKTTAVGRLAKKLVDEHHSVVLGAADTFRAAAGDQLQTWGERVGVTTIRGVENADPASVAFNAVETAIVTKADTVIIDTAGRLHTKSGLMDELGKVKRVIEKQLPVGETLLVIDATTGQNGLAQARVFAEAVDITGIVLTKLDGTAKGGIVLAVQNELKVPVKLVGVGEGADDLEIFDPQDFVSALLA